MTVNQDQMIVIESTNPEIVYVPEYGTAVYGGGYGLPRAVLPVTCTRPGGASSGSAPAWSSAARSGGTPTGAAGGNCNVDIDVNRNNNWNNRVNNNWQNNSNRNWNHNAEHRGA